MRILVLAVGRLRPPYADDVQHYQKLLAGHTRLELVEVREDEQVAKRIPDRCFKVLLAADGQTFDSEGFSRFLEERRQSGMNLCFVIGGPRGLSLGECDLRLSLGPDDLAPPTRAGGAAGAALPLAQDHRQGAVPLLGARPSP